MKRLTDIFKPEHIAAGLQAVNKDALLEEMVTFLTRSHGMTRGEEILNAIRLRENKMSTGIKRGIAVPHARIPSFGETAGVLGIHSPGVDFDSLDGNPVHVIFLFVSDFDAPDEHLSVLAQIGAMTEQEGFFEGMLVAHTITEAAATLAKYEVRIT